MEVESITLAGTQLAQGELASSWLLIPGGQLPRSAAWQGTPFCNAASGAQDRGPLTAAHVQQQAVM